MLPVWLVDLIFLVIIFGGLAAVFGLCLLYLRLTGQATSGDPPQKERNE